MCIRDSLDKSIKSKIALFCNVDEDAVITAKDVSSIYEVPLAFRDEGLDEKITQVLNIWTGQPELRAWERLIEAQRNPESEVRIVMVGKYVDLAESYKSLNEALVHGGMAVRAKVNIDYVDSEKLEDPGVLQGADGVLVPHGFGSRGAEGKIRAVQYARENEIPFLGICFGMQLACCEFARHVAGCEGANSREVDPETPHPVIDLMPGQVEVEDKGATMRLGDYPCGLEPGSRAHAIYGEREIAERHRHEAALLATGSGRPEAAAHGWWRVVGAVRWEQMQIQE